MNRPTFIGIGAQKCATSWLYRALEGHPDVFVSEPKELDFFSDKYHYGFNWYNSCFTGRVAEQVIGELSPSYFCDASAPMRAFDFNPDLKIIVSLRNPVERAFSNHLHEIRVKHYLDQDLAFSKGLSNNPMYIEQSMYYRHLKNWLAVFPFDQLICFFQEEIAVDPTSQLTRLYAFLGVDPSVNPDYLNKRANESTVAKSKTLDRVVKTAGKALRAVGLGQIVVALKSTSAARTIIKLNTKSLRSIVPEMRTSTRNELEELFAAEDRRLMELLRLDALPWDHGRTVAMRRPGDV